ncbi:MAG: hypothetical protein ACLT40_01350 [Fusobacterium sp.]
MEKMILKGWIKFSGSVWLNKNLYLTDDKERKHQKREDRIFDKLSIFENKFVAVRFAFKNKEFENIDEELFTQLYGDYQEGLEDFNISEITSSDYKKGIVGGHDLYKILECYVDKYMIFEIKEVEKPDYWK